MITLPAKTVYRCDRNYVSYYKPRPTAGGVCIYMSNLYANYTVRFDDCSKITQDFEILLLLDLIIVIIRVYKPRIVLTT